MEDTELHPHLALCESDVKDNMLEVTKVNDVYIKIDCQNSIAQELCDFFTYEVPGHKFMPAFKRRKWDGKMRLFNVASRRIYAGLLPHVRAFAQERKYGFLYGEDEYQIYPMETVKNFFEDLNLPKDRTPRDYQLEGFIQCISSKRGVVVSPTGSGKSLMIYALSQWFTDEKVVIIVPTISLVAQMYKDFVDYGGNGEEIHCVQAGVNPQTDKRITISTWQSLVKLPKKFFSQFGVVIGDECHSFKSKSLVSIMTRLERCKYRFGFTGTLDGMDIHKLVLEGLFGRARKNVSTKELMDKKQLASLNIKCVLFSYTDQECKLVSNMDYSNELDWIVSNKKRNKFITDLACQQTENTLLLFQYVEKHGKILYDLIKEQVNADRKIFFVYGGTDSDSREKVRAICEVHRGCIIVASVGVFSTGINIRNLHNIIFGSPSKSRIRNLQSIGRSLRVTKQKSFAKIFDLADDLRYNGKPNYTLRHFAERIKIYKDEQFSYSVVNVT